MARLVVAALLLVLAAPPLAAAPDAPPQPGVRLLFPEPAWAGGETMLAHIQAQLAQPAPIAVHFDDLARVERVRRVGDQMMHELVRHDGTRDTVALPVRKNDPSLLLDLSAFPSTLFVRAEQSALMAFLRPDSWPEGHNATQITATSRSSAVSAAAHDVANTLGIPSDGPGTWHISRASQCDFTITVPGGSGAGAGPSHDYRTGRHVTSWSTSGGWTDEYVGVGPCWEATTPDDLRGTGMNEARIRFADAPRRVIVESAYWVDVDDDAWPSRWELRDLMREDFVWEGGAVAFYEHHGRFFDGRSLAVEELWQATSHVRGLQWGVFDDLCRPFAFGAVSQDAFSGAVLEAHRPHLAGAHSCPGGRPLSAVQHVRADPAADHSVRTPVGPFSDDAQTFAQRLAAAAGSEPFLWAMEHFGTWSVDVTPAGEDRWRLSFDHKDSPTTSAVVLRATVVEPASGPDAAGIPVTLAPAPPTSPTDPARQLTPVPRPGVYATYIEIPSTVFGSGYSRDIYIRPGTAGFEDLPSAARILAQLGMPGAADTAWRELGPVEALKPLPLGGGSHLFLECACRSFELAPAPLVDGANRVEAVVSPDGSVVSLHLDPWIDVPAWGLMEDAAAEAMARAALTDDLARVVAVVDLVRTVDLRQREIYNTWTFEGPDRWGQDRTWKLLQHGHTGQVILVTGDPPLHDQTVERFFEEMAGGWRLAFVVSLVALYPLLRRGRPRSLLQRGS